MARARGDRARSIAKALFTVPTLACASWIMVSLAPCTLPRYFSFLARSLSLSLPCSLPFLALASTIVDILFGNVLADK